MVARMIVVTTGGVFIGLALLGWQWVMWWPGKKSLMKDPLEHAAALLPFLLAWAYGALGILTTAGLIGWAFDTALWASNWLGDAVGWAGVGARVQQTASGALLPLTGNGNWAVLAMTVIFIACLVKNKGNDTAGELKRGVWCGLCLGTSATFASFTAVPLAQGANVLGNVIATGRFG